MGGSKRHLGSAEVLLQVQKAEKEVGEAQTQVVLDLERRCLEAESQADSLRRQLEAGCVPVWADHARPSLRAV